MKNNIKIHNLKEKHNYMALKKAILKNKKLKIQLL